MGKWTARVGFAGGLLALGGCAAPDTTTSSGHRHASSASDPAEHPEAVTVAVAQGSDLSFCSGTLLARSVVLTSAHCVGHGERMAVATAGPDARISRVTVAHFYDWDPKRNESDRPGQTDLALLTLDKPIALASYPKVSTASFEGAVVYQAASEKPLRVATGAPAGHARALFVPKAAADDGGALFQTDANGRMLLAGVLIGIGAETHGGYVQRLSDKKVAAWIGSVVGGATSSNASTSTRSLHVLTLEDGDGDDGGEAGSGEGNGDDPVEPAGDTPDNADNATKDGPADEANAGKDETSNPNPTSAAASNAGSSNTNENTNDASAAQSVTEAQGQTSEESKKEAGAPQAAPRSLEEMVTMMRGPDDRQALTPRDPETISGVAQATKGGDETKKQIGLNLP